jgi:transposase
MEAESVAAKYDVNRAWVHRFVQRRRETGSIAPRPQTEFRVRVLAGQDARLAALIAARPDATLAEFRDALDRVVEHPLARDRAFGLYRQKNGTRRRTKPALMSPRRAASGTRGAPARHAPVR